MNLESIARTAAPEASSTTPVVRADAGRPRQVRAGSNGSENEEAAASDVSRTEVDRAVEVANARLESLNEKLGFQVHDATGQIVVQIVNRETGEIVRETPAREFLDLSARMKEMVGFFLDERG